MTTRKETVTRELLDSVNDPSGLEAVFERHRQSKGPFYLALAEATSQIQQRLRQAGENLSGLETKKDQLEEFIEALEARHGELEEKESVLVERVARAEERLVLAEEPLGKARALESQGFGEMELTRLNELLGQAAASHGLATEQGVVRFFETVKDYTRVLSFELETSLAETRTATAKAEAKRWEAEAKSKEAHSKARIATINTVVRLLEKGVREKDFRQWERIIERAGVSAESVAKELERYGSLEKLCEERNRRSDELHGHVGQAEARLRALSKEEGAVKASIGAIRDGALKEMEQIGRQARQHLEGLLVSLKDYGELQQAADALKEDISVARAFKSLDAGEWAKVPRYSIQRMMLGVILWGKADGRNRMLAPPEPVRQRTRSLTTWHQVSLTDLMLWALSGVTTEQDLRTLAGG